MMKLFKTILVLAGMSLGTIVNATEITIDEKEIPTIKVGRGTHTARFIELSDIEEIGSISKEACPEGLPQDVAKWAENLINRRNGGNWYSCLTIKEKEEGKIVAFLGLGRMPALNYDPKFTDIIKTWMNFKVIQQINSEDGYNKDNFKRVENAGIAFILPIIPISLSTEDKNNIITMGTDVVEFFKSKNFLLPIEKTLPHDVITLLSSKDSLGKNFQEAGYELIEKEGFFGFYDKERIMLHKAL